MLKSLPKCVRWASTVFDIFQQRLQKVDVARKAIRETALGDIAEVHGDARLVIVCDSAETDNTKRAV